MQLPLGSEIDNASSCVVCLCILLVLYLQKCIESNIGCPGFAEAFPQCDGSVSMHCQIQVIMTNTFAYKEDANTSLLLAITDTYGR